MPTNQEIFAALLQQKQQESALEQTQQGMMSDVAKKVVTKHLTEKAEEALQTPGGDKALLSSILPDPAQQGQQSGQSQQQVQQQASQEPLSEQDKFFQAMNNYLAQANKPVSTRERIGRGFLAGAGLDPDKVLGSSSGVDVLDNLVKMQKLQQLPFEMQQEQRRVEQEDRRILDLKLDTIADRGGIITSSEINKINEGFGFDSFTPAIEALGIPAEINEETGERSYNVPASRDLAEIAKRKTVSSKEIEYFQDQYDAADTMQEVLTGLADLGIKDLRSIGEIEFEEGVSSDFGPFSIPARFNLVGQFAKDPKYTAIKSKLERAFQKYRKVITGAQASDKELTKLRPLIAAFSQRPEVFFEVANDLINETNRSVDSRLDLMKNIGRDVTKLEERHKERKSKSGSAVAAGLGGLSSDQQKEISDIDTQLADIEKQIQAQQNQNIKIQGL